MTCSTCKHYYICPHKVKDRPCEGYCIRYPTWVHKNQTTVKCGDWKTMVKRKQTKNVVEYSDEFKAFYEAYPKKISPNVAWRSWSDKTVLLPEHYQLVIERAKGYAEAVVSEGKDMQYVKHPSTWLRAGDWKTETEKKVGEKDCIVCSAPYSEGHKYRINTRTNKKEYKCEKCRKV